MKKLTSFMLASMLVLSLSACAGMNAQEESARVKCPACGYEFDTMSMP